MLPFNQLIDSLLEIQDDLACDASKNAFSIQRIAEVIEQLHMRVGQSVQENHATKQ